MLASLLFVVDARAEAPQALPPEGLEIAAEGVTARVRAIQFPEPTAAALQSPPSSGSAGATPVGATPLAPPDSVGAICPFVLKVAKGAASLARTAECPEALAAQVDAALAGWQVEVQGSADVAMSELWWVFPAPDKGGPRPVRLFVRPQAGREVTAHAKQVGVLDWRLTAQVPLEYPENVGDDTASSWCHARIDVAGTGMPGKIDVSGCDAVFADALRDGLRRWRFAGGQEVDGRPLRSAITIEARFVRTGSVEEVDVVLPTAPDLGRAEAPGELVKWEPPPLPAGPPQLVVDHKSFAQVEVYEMVWPTVEAADEERRCEMLFQVNSVRRVWAWSEACDESVRQASEVAGTEWKMKPGVIERGERLARFRGVFVFPAGATEPVLWVPIDDVVTNPGKLPEAVHTYRAAKSVVTVPPRLPKSGPPVDAACEYSVEVDARGRPTDIAPVGACPEEIEPLARRAVGKWRWMPAEVDGQPVRSTVTARLRVDR